MSAWSYWLAALWLAFKASRYVVRSVFLPPIPEGWKAESAITVRMIGLALTALAFQHLFAWRAWP